MLGEDEQWDSTQSAFSPFYGVVQISCFLLCQPGSSHASQKLEINSLWIGFSAVARFFG
jgi:hypothetical protein